ncbi:small multi-drug export protein [Candidatus Omnitrophota bacterium]
MEQTNKTINKNRNTLSILINSSEKVVIFAGIGLILSFIAWLSLESIWSIEKYQKLITLFGVRFLTGRPGGVYFGYLLKLRYVEIFAINIFVDTVSVLILYPLFVLSYHVLLETKFLKNKIQYTFQLAQKNHAIIKKYGKVGLFLFVLFPMWGTGPVVGCAIGIIMGLNRWMNLTIVLSATYLAILCWAFLLTGFHQWLLSYSSFAPFVFIIILFLLGVGTHLLGKIKRRDKNVDEMVTMEDDS